MLTGCVKRVCLSVPVCSPGHQLHLQLVQRCQSTFQSSQLEITPASPSKLKPKPAVKDLVFGKYFTDHMLRIRWTSDKGWDVPQIGPLQPFQMHPAAKVLHYAQELFEGMKAYRGVDDEIRLFRPRHNMARMISSAKRACLPTFEAEELLDCMRRLIQIDQEWVPHSESSSLYIRPTMIGTDPQLGVAPAHEAELFVILSPVGPYFSTGVKPVNLLADPKYVRAWPGGCGFAKMGSNYAPTMWTQKIAERYNCQQCLWLYGPDHIITEVGAMNIFVLLDKGNGAKELVTPPLDQGIILPGITRKSILELTRDWNEFEVNERQITMKEVMKAQSEGKLIEMFGAGTAAIVSPVGNIYYDGKLRPIPVDASENAVSQRILKSMSDIYYGRKAHPWAVSIENWSFDPNEKLRLQDYQDDITRQLAAEN